MDSVDLVLALGEPVTFVRVVMGVDYLALLFESRHGLLGFLLGISNVVGALQQQKGRLGVFEGSVTWRSSGPDDADSITVANKIIRAMPVLISTSRQRRLEFALCHDQLHAEFGAGAASATPVVPLERLALTSLSSES